MIFNFLDQHRWWFIATMATLAGIATGGFILGFAPEAAALYTRNATIAAGIAAFATSIYFLTSSHARRLWELFRLRWQVRRRESLLREVAQKIEQCEKDSVRWRDAQPVTFEIKEILAMATEQEKTSLQKLLI